MNKIKQFFDSKKIVLNDNILYSINEDDKTARIICCNNQISDIKIPSSIIFESKEFFIISIEENAFNDNPINSIQFSDDSKLQMIKKGAFFNILIEYIKIPSEVTRIGKNAFSHCQILRQIEIPNDSKLETIKKFAFSFSSIESITITSKLVELEEGWCGFTSKLNAVDVSLDNPRYLCLDKQIIIGKSSIEQSNYDEVVFCIRNAESIRIPDYIKYINSYAFSECKNLRVIEISDNSQLQKIGREVFFNSAIERIKIPSKIVELKEGWCNRTPKLVNVIVHQS